MTTWNPQANALFLDALELRVPHERLEFLDRTCADNAELRAEVEAMLAASEKAGSFLEASPARRANTLAQPATERPGSVIGPYKLLQQIGEGGMGVVWMAEQTEPVKRKVAVKVIKPGMDSRQVIARFESERQALAMMDHVNIARVFDGGTAENGRPYFVMELVHGVPITKYCDDNHLTPRERLELFVPVCQAIQHAHQKGIIHRDIKPSNVMVTLYDGQPVPKVIDFGVAKATEQKLTERTLFTQYGTMVGTLEYMSPEQAEMSSLGVDTRSDIYSLGVLLYELLTGSTPLDRKRVKEAAYAEILRIIKEEEPPKPSTRLSDSGEALASISAQRHTEPAKLSKLMRGELDWIVMKTLEKDRNRRYETASGFAADVQRYLNDDPVQACPPSMGYRLRKFVSRNKGPVLAGAIVLLALVGGIAGTTWGLLRAERARQAEVARAEGERKAKQYAEAREAEMRAVLAFVEDKIFAAAQPEGRAGGLGHDVTLRRAVEAALSFVDQSFADQPLIEARLRRTLGKSFLRLGEARIAAEQHEKARKLFTQHLGADHANTLRSVGDLANSYADLGRHSDALELREGMLPLFKAKLGLHHPDTLISMGALANSYRDLGRHAEAVKLHEETLTLQKATLGPDHPHTLISMGDLANGYRRLGRHVEAVKLHEEALALNKRTRGPDHPDTLWSMNNLALSYGDLGRHAEALKLHEETLALQKAKLGLDHPHTLTSMSNAASSYDRLGRHAEALKLHEETLALKKTKLGPHHPDTLESMNNLGYSYNAVSRDADALKLLEEILAVQQVSLAPDHPDIVRSMNNLAEIYRALDRNADALKLHEQTLALNKAKFGPDHPDTLRSMNGLALSYSAVGRNSDAVKLHEETLAIAKSNFGPEHPDTLRSMNNLAESYRAERRYDDALELHAETLAIKKSKFGADHPDTIGSIANLALSYDGVGAHPDAVKLHKQALAFRKASLGPDHPDTLMSMNNLANTYTAMGRYTDSLKLHEETLALQKATLGTEHPDTLGSMHNVAISYAVLGRHAEALKLYEQTLALRKAKLGPEHPDTLASMNHLAWALAIDSGPAARNPERALQLAKEAVELAPKDGAIWNTLGAAHYRAGDWKAAITALEKSMELVADEGLSFNAFFLAMAHWQLGEQDEARKWHHQAVEWMEKNRPKDEELLRFRREAAELLGVAEPKGESDQ